MSILGGQFRHRASTAAASMVLVTGALLGGGLTMAPPAFADEPAAEQEVAHFEVDFMKDMIDHHALGVMMAQTCLEKAIHEELTDLCQTIIDSQSTQIETMQGWLQDWYGHDHEPQLSSYDRLSARNLEHWSGDEYEIQFMRSMTSHHKGAVTDSDRCLDRAEHPELLGLCRTIHESNSKQIDMMQGWLQQWYGLRSGYSGY
ncbi:DUF305 domain-containing protein [Nocardiopsis dassonvillei]|uniref:DUF305 domain-containing protein n=1 Tax=Nocardiopsis dassonvillei TaxID=2014 RepID=UPI0003678087|nr:DUF305 domain-containing protein [Nocardiopsis dassonvillei]MCK9872344.1 DUF305 domain-containing protein [Nocardiopsis dassonvillei]